jgi:hypothetical protein
MVRQSIDDHALMKVSLWARWKAVARVAARVQSNVILTILYFLVFLPLALIRRPFAGPFGGDAPGWLERPPAARDLPAARRQY